jgi:hypothetical protein
MGVFSGASTKNKIKHHSPYFFYKKNKNRLHNPWFFLAMDDPQQRLVWRTIASLWNLSALDHQPQVTSARVESALRQYASFGSLAREPYIEQFLKRLLPLCVGPVDLVGIHVLWAVVLEKWGANEDALAMLDREDLAAVVLAERRRMSELCPRHDFDLDDLDDLDDTVEEVSADDIEVCTCASLRILRCFDEVRQRLRSGMQQASPSCS